MKIFYTVIIIATIWSSYFLYNAKYEAREAQKKIARLMIEVNKEKETVKVLKAEWSYLNRPEHLKILNNQLLKLRYTETSQIGHFRDIDSVINDRIAILSSQAVAGEKPKSKAGSSSGSNIKDHTQNNAKNAKGVPQIGSIKIIPKISSKAPSKKGYKPNLIYNQKYKKQLDHLFNKLSKTHKF